MTHSKVKHLRCLLCSKAYSAHKSLRSHLLSSHNITSNHPDYKQCYYSMTPEEAGVKISEVQRVTNQSSRTNGHISDKHALTKPVLLRPKSEPVSSDCDSEDHRSQSDQEDEDRNEPIVHKDSVTTTVLIPPSFPVKTKAAMKQLPFSVLVEEKKVGKSIRGGHSSLRKKLKPISSPKQSVPSTKLPKSNYVKKSKTCK